MKNLFLSLIALFLTSCATDWRTASKESANISPKPEQLNESIVQVFVARTVKWRGYFAVHPWISWKLKEDDQYTVTQVIGWRTRRGLPAVVTMNDLPDRHWFGSKPELIYEIRGDQATKAIEQMKSLIPSYPFANDYRAWPGPNSNTYIAHLIRETKELTVELPPHAIGKDMLVDSYLFEKTASGTGFQFSIFGVLGFQLGLKEGVEVNLFGLNFGVDFWTPALKLPMIGRIGFDDQ
tara:strand:+ start:9922 stop:10632 length:711 start_codon:yes stop_codon:yes gene_type:complete